MQKKKKKARNKKAEKTGVKLSKSPVTSKTLKKPASSTPIAPLNIWRAFDDVFERFRRDFEEHLFPAPWTATLPLLPDKRVPIVDLEDRGKDYLLKAEMPGFKKEDIEIEVQDNSITISGKAGWKYDKKAETYICRERACESFYRIMQLPEEIKADDVKANLTDGVLEIVLPKRTIKPKRKVKVD